ncbi:sugar transferase [Sphingomonas sp. Mn802worker]|uniref:sugar transferase n=1 Tax=Sphingomonas sp. Mn802worker TaxID=629773 RepID=UPI00036CE807|nr:sugar transferase [Sphingomonas sp. Mn802worker]
MSLIALDGVGSAVRAKEVSSGSHRVPLLSGGQRRLQARVALLCGDLVALGVAPVLASLSQGRGTGDQFLALIAVIIPLYITIAASRAAYDRDALINPMRGLRRALSSFMLVSLLTLGLGFAFKVTAEYSRIEQSVAFVLAAAFLIGARAINAWMVRSFFPYGLIDELLLHDGAANGTKRFFRTLHVADGGLAPTLDCPHMLDRISRACAGSDRILLSVVPAVRANWIAVLKGLGTDVHVVMPELEPLGILAIGNACDHLTAVVAHGPLRRPDAMVKRAFDLAVVLALLPGIAVVTLLVAVAIRLEDGGPVFFRQTRIGRANRQFAVLKFRSMRAEACDANGHASAERGDARVTRVGNILRKTSLDELPQFFNVVMGDMSIVGPRPHALGSRAADALFWEVDQRYFQRHAVKPGITGLAQVRGLRGATERAEDLTERVQADLEYITNWSIWRDLRIAVLTLKVLLHPKAY